MLLVDSSGLLFSLIVKRDDEDGHIGRLQLELLLSNQKTAVADGQQLPLVQEKTPLVIG